MKAFPTGIAGRIPLPEGEEVSSFPFSWGFMHYQMKWLHLPIRFHLWNVVFYERAVSSFQELYSNYQRQCNNNISSTVLILFTSHIILHCFITTMD